MTINFFFTRIWSLCHNVQTATLLINFGFGHVFQYTPFILNLSALHFTHFYPTIEGVTKFAFRHTLFSYL